MNAKRIGKSLRTDRPLPRTQFVQQGKQAFSTGYLFGPNN